MNALASLRWKILALFLLNLAVVVSVAILFLRAQIRVGISSLVAGPIGDRLEAIAVPLAAELRGLPKSAWPSALDGAAAQWRARGVKAAFFTNDGVAVSGDLTSAPAEVKAMLSTLHQRRSPRPPPRPRPGEPPAPTSQIPNAPIQKFFMAAGQPSQYWAGILLGDMDRPQPGVPPISTILIFASPSLRGGGLFFDYVPWLWAAGGVLAVSMLLWLPFVHRLTASLTRMTRIAENIAEGHFATPRIPARRDEIGRLGRAIRDMAIRLENFASGQKRFLGDTAHELLSPIARLELTLSILEQRSAAADRSYIDCSLEEVRQISALVQDLLNFSKAGLKREVKLETVALKPLVEDVIRLECLYDASLVLRIPQDLRVLAQADLLSRAFSNVLRNALRYAAADGEIEIQASATPSGEATLVVSDHGPGVPPEALPRLFDPFFRPDTARTREAGGTGLGLAIVKSCIEACGGRVTARNGEPSGLEVEFVLRMK